MMRVGDSPSSVPAKRKRGLEFGSVIGTIIPVNYWRCYGVKAASMCCINHSLNIVDINDINMTRHYNEFSLPPLVIIRVQCFNS